MRLGHPVDLHHQIWQAGFCLERIRKVEPLFGTEHDAEPPRRRPRGVHIDRDEGLLELHGVLCLEAAVGGLLVGLADGEQHDRRVLHGLRHGLQSGPGHRLDVQPHLVVGSRQPVLQRQNGRLVSPRVR